MSYGVSFPSGSIQGAVISGMCMCTRDRCETMCTLKLRVAKSAIYVHAHLGKMQNTLWNFPSLAYNLYPKAGNNTFIMQYSLTKVCPSRLGNKELPPTWGYWRPIPNTSIPRICPAVLSAIYFLYHSEVGGSSYSNSPPCKICTTVAANTTVLRLIPSIIIPIFHKRIFLVFLLTHYIYSYISLVS